MPIGERMKLLRKERQWSQGDLAERIGADARQISRYENGRILPSVEVLARIADAFDVSADYLMFPDAPRRPLRVSDPGLAQRLADLTELAPDDRQSLLHVLDAFLTRKRLQDLAAR